MEREPDNADGIFKTRIIPYWITIKLEGGHKVDKNSKKSYKKTI